VAILSDAGSLTYDALRRRANQLAHTLLARGLVPGTHVGVLLERSMDAVVAFLGILKAGCAYVPLEPTHPPARLALLVEDSGAAVVITRSTLLERLPPGPVLCVDSDAELIASAPELAPPPLADASSLAYVMYTSGTTGQPKGVLVPHRGIHRLVCGNGVFSFSSRDRVLHASPLAFDASTFEIWGALANGGCLVILSQDTLLSPRDFARRASEAGLTVAFFTSALFNQLARVAPESLRGLSCLVVGGDVCDPRAAREVLARASPRLLLNGYGPTECTTFATFHRIQDVPEGAVSVPIGRAIVGTETHVLDEHLRWVPPGQAGELYIGGEGVALGYLNRPGLTAERFVPSPFARTPGQVLFRTGDRVRLLPDGTLEFLGRLDQQIKLRGFRIEPGEVEAALLQHPEVAQGVVCLREDPPAGRRLVAYVVPRAAGACVPTVLRRFLEERLPEPAVPSAFVVLESLPLTSTGKVDRAALPAPGRERPLLDTAYAPPRSPVEHAIAALWVEALGVSPIGIHDDFLTLGGSSLQAAHIAARAQRELGVEVPLSLLLGSTTVASLAEALRGRVRPEEVGALPPPLGAAHGEGLARLSFAQQQLWFLHQLNPHSAAYVLPIAFRLSGPLEHAALEAGLARLVERHEALRTTFPSEGSEPMARVGPAVSPPFSTLDFTGLAGPEQEPALRALARSEAATSFDLSRGPLLRVRLVRLAPDSHVLLLVIHHIICDGWSVGVLMRELAALLEASATHEAPALPPLPATPRDHAAWQRDWMSSDVLALEMEHWRRELAGAPQVLALPIARPRPAMPTQRGAQFRFSIPDGTSGALGALAREAGATPFMLYLAAFAVLLHRHTGSEDFLVGAPTAGRPLPEFEGLVGHFVNTLPLRLRPQAGLRFRELLQHVRERVLTALAHGSTPFDQLVRTLCPVREPGHPPLVQVVFALQSPPADLTTTTRLRLRFEELDNGAAPFDLVFQLWEREGRMEGSVVYATELFEEATAARLADEYVRLLGAIVEDPGAHLSTLVRAGEDVERSGALLREAEARILAHPQVLDCAVRLRRNPDGRIERVAYVATPDPVALARLGVGLGLLPPLAPSVVVPLSQLPLDEAGRVDEAALQRLGVEGAGAALELPAVPAHAEPESPVERMASPPARLALSDGGALEIPPGAPLTLTEALLRTSRERGARGISYVEAEGASDFQSYATLLEEARWVLGGLVQQGLGPGARVILQLDLLRDHFTTFWACLLGGLTPVTVAVASSYEEANGVNAKLYNTWKHLRRPVLVASRRLARALRGLRSIYPDMENPTVLVIEDLRQGPRVESLHVAAPEDVAFLQLSSGSTGVPKCIQETHRGVIHHIHGARIFNGYDEGDVSLNWLPVDHVAPMLTYHLKAVYLGIPEVQVRTELCLGEPLLWLELMERHRVTHSWSPNFGFKLVADALARAPGRRWDLSGLRRLMNAGEQVTLPVVRDFLERTAPFGLGTRVMQPAYGMAEVCTAMTFNNDFDLGSSVRWIAKASLRGHLEDAPAGDPAAVAFFDVGPPVPGVRIRIVDAQGRVLPERTIGRLHIQGAVVTPGYLDNDAANREAFTEDGWFNSGDLAFIEQGRLVITGREKEIIIVRGANFPCYEIEDLVGSVPGVEPTFIAACAAADPRGGTEGLALFFVARDDSPEGRARTAATIRSTVTARLGLAPACVVPLSRADFPKTTSGKIQRTQLRRWLEGGRFTSVLAELDARTVKASAGQEALFRRTWVRRQPGLEAPSGTGHVVVLLDALGLGERVLERLRASGRPVVAVEVGERFERLGRERFRIAAHEPGSYRQLFEVLAREETALGGVVHLLAHEDGPPGLAGPEAVARGLASGVYSLLFLAQALEVWNAARPLRLLVASTRTQAVRQGEPLAPHQAALLGVVQSLSREAPGIDCRHVDLVAGEEAAAEVLVHELFVGAREAEVAYRDGQRYVARLAQVDPSSGGRPSPWVHGGCYLVSGGLGGLGVLVGRHLLERHAARLLILGRGPLGPEGSESPRRRAYEELVSVAGDAERVLYVAADVADAGAVRAAVAGAEARWGARLDGVLHLAGVIAERTLAEETAASFGATLHPKVMGGLTLAALAAERPGSLFLAFSSANAALGGFAAGAYASANRFIEHLVLALREYGVDARCVAWSLWEGVGMSQGLATKGLARSRGYLSLSSAQGLEALAVCLEQAEPCLIVGLDAQHPQIAARLTGAPVVHPPSELPMEELPAEEGGPQRAPLTETERQVAETWRDVLGRDSIGTSDNFFDLGGDSMLVAQVRARLRKAFGKELPVVELFRHPTIAALARYLDNVPAAAPAPKASPRSRTGAVAIVGMACRVPGAADVEAFWANLCRGVESIQPLNDAALLEAGVAPALLEDRRYVRARGALDEVALFDASFFGMSAREAEITDPQHRVFLECAWEALEHAGCDPSRISGKAGVFAGAGPNGYFLHHLHPHRALLDTMGAMPALLGNDRDFLATRVAYKLGLRGPALTVQTACSTALVAVHLAARSLRDGECDVALAGGVSIAFPLNEGYLYQEGHILSPDGHCRAFDAQARGTVPGDGAGVVVLKRLEDALAEGDTVHAVLLGSAINNDGMGKVGFTAPSIQGQADVITAALASAGVRAGSIGYVEAHGTGTVLGDSIEVAALTQVFQAEEGAPGRCGLGSVKTNVGHLAAAAGVASLIKATLALEHRTLPPSLHFRAPNPEIAFDRGPFQVNTSLRSWERGAEPRRAGVSAFGFGGTNAHAVLEEAPEVVREPSLRPCQLLVLSASSEKGLEAMSRRLGAHLKRHPSLDVADVAWTLATGRRAFEYRRAIRCRSTAQAVAALERGEWLAAPQGVAARGVAFLFPGQGSQYAGMSRELFHTEPVFRRHLDACASLLAPHGVDLMHALYGEQSGEALTRTALAQPALFAVEYALARMWMEWGVKPAALLGHSVGEYVAACLAGVFSLADACALVAERGRLMQALPPGAMLAVPLSEQELLPLLGAGAELAAVNGPHACVAAGPEGAIAALEQRLAARGTPGKRLRTSHAFHSAMMEPALAAFQARVASVPRSAPGIAYLSNLTGTWVTAAQATDPGAWALHLRRPVRFGEGLRELVEAGYVLLEVGPGRALSVLASSLAPARGGGASSLTLWSLPPPRPEGLEAAAVRDALGTLWAAGVEVDWAAHYAGEQRRKVPLPTYPFERRRYWIDPPHAPPRTASEAGEEEARALDEAEARILRERAVPSLESYPGLVEGLEALCTSHLVHYAASRGVEVRAGAVLTREEFLGKLGTVARLGRLLEAMMGLLARDGVLAPEGDRVRFLRNMGDFRPPAVLRQALEARHPGFEGLYQFLEHCVSHYPDALSGRIEAISVLYPGGNSHFINECERRTVQYRSEHVYIALLAEALQRLGRASPGRRLRILEVGGGRALATFQLLEALQGVEVEYCFTDLGRTFVEDARAEAARRGQSGRMSFGVLDASRDASSQGYTPGSFDVVVAFNVVHATRDVALTVRNLRALLVAGGTLALVEAVRTARWETLTWGLAEGWWYYDDTLRKDSPLLALDVWEQLLERERFERVRGWPRAGSARALSDHGLVLGRRPLEEEVPRREQGTSPAATPTPAPSAPAPAAHPRPALRTAYVAPRTDVEREIALICQELLGVERIGVQDDFFELGADSLITLRITDHVRQRLGREVPAHAAFRGATVERMAQSLSGGVAGPSASPVLVPLQRGGSLPPLFFVHPAGGVVFPFVELARQLGPEQPFYGLQAAGLDGEGLPDVHVEDMARRYIEAIRTVSPRGPYYLGGFSFGCLVAYEMATQLRRAGEEVRFLGMVDEPAPVDGHRPSPFIMAKLLTSGAAKTAWPYLHDYFYLRHARGSGEDTGRSDKRLPSLRQLLTRGEGKNELLESFLARAAMSHFIRPEDRPLALRQPAMIPMFRLFLLHVRETLEYQPRAYDGRITVLKCTRLGGRNRKDPTFGWGLLAAGGVDVHELPGEHLTLLRQPYVQLLADRLRRSLDEARRSR
jgi:amino acid adenylation domain-containing protein